MLISSRRQLDGVHLSHSYSYSNNKVYRYSHIQTSHLKKLYEVRERAVKKHQSQPST